MRRYAFFELLYGIIKVAPVLLGALVLWRLREPLARLADTLSRLVTVLARLIVIATRLTLAAAAALGCGLLAVGVLSADNENAMWMGIAAGLAGLAAALWLTRDSGRSPDDTAALVPRITTPRRDVVWRRVAAPYSTRTPLPSHVLEPHPHPDAAVHHPASAPSPRQVPPLVADALRARLAQTEQALARAGRDAIGAPAEEWLAFMQRRVPDLIAAAQDVYDDAPAREKAGVADRLAQHLEGIVTEADQRLAVVLAARRDLFSTRGSHAEGRIRDG